MAYLPCAYISPSPGMCVCVYYWQVRILLKVAKLAGPGRAETEKKKQKPNQKQKQKCRRRRRQSTESKSEIFEPKTWSRPVRTKHKPKSKTEKHLPSGCPEWSSQRLFSFRFSFSFYLARWRLPKNTNHKSVSGLSEFSAKLIRGGAPVVALIAPLRNHKKSSVLQPEVRQQQAILLLSREKLLTFRWHLFAQCRRIIETARLASQPVSQWSLFQLIRHINM